MILEETIKDGGGFNQALNAILQFQKIALGHFDWLVITTQVENIHTLREMGIQAKIYKTSLSGKLIQNLFLYSLTRAICNKLKIQTAFERILIKQGCNLVYFLAPSIKIKYLQKLNYIATIWDDCHRDFPEFPEVREGGEFSRRELIYSELPSAVLTIVDSDLLADRLCHRYGLDRNRLLAMAFSPNHQISIEDHEQSNNVLLKYDLTPGYFFYPAQFWPHKNHVRILEALELLNLDDLHIKVVFVGGDKGNLSLIVRMIKQFGLENQVFNLGFVPTEHMGPLYKECAAVLMPTYFGPTNLPPIEAWQFNRPLIYSKHLKDQCGDAAILIDPDSAESLAYGIKEALSKDASSKLITLGAAKLDEISNSRKDSERELFIRLKKFEARLKTWDIAAK